MNPAPNGFQINFNFAAQDNGGGGLPFPAMATGPPVVSVTTTRTSNAGDANGGLSFSVSGDASARVTGTPPSAMTLEMLIQGKRTSIENQKRNAENQRRNVENLEKQLAFLEMELAKVKGADGVDGKVDVDPSDGDLASLIRAKRRTIKAQERNLENLRAQLVLLERDLAKAPSAPPARGNDDGDDDDAKAN